MCDDCRQIAEEYQELFDYAVDVWVQLERMGYSYVAVPVHDGLVVGQIFKDGKLVSTTRRAITGKEMEVTRKP